MKVTRPAPPATGPARAARAPARKVAAKPSGGKKTSAGKTTARPSAAANSDIDGVEVLQDVAAQPVAPDVADCPPEARVALLERISAAVEHELSQIEAVVGTSRIKSTEVERRARTLASLARTLAELRRMRAQDDLKRSDDDGAEPRDIETFRLELARKLERLVSEAKALHPELPGST